MNDREQQRTSRARWRLHCKVARPSRVSERAAATLLAAVVRSSARRGNTGDSLARVALSYESQGREDSKTASRRKRGKTTVKVGAVHIAKIWDPWCHERRAVVSGWQRGA
jgi:hypothetical protein